MIIYQGWNSVTVACVT